jgi:hypothetical protein
MSHSRDVTISIVVPCWHDAERAFSLARGWKSHPAVAEVILAGVKGSEPQTVSANEKHIKWCAAAMPSRGGQMNHGTRPATGSVLLFHHVDSELTLQHIDAIINALHDPVVIGGAFYRKFDERHSFLRFFEKIERIHCRAFGTVYGDQSVFVRREIFQQLGGFAPIPLMEDVEFSRRLRRAGKIVVLDPPMRSSPARQIAQGTWRVTLRNLLFLIAFRCGVSAYALHRWYYADAVHPTRDAQPIPVVLAE